MQHLEPTWRGSLPRGGKGDPTFIIYPKSWSTRSISPGTGPRKKSWTGKWSRSYAFLEGWRNCWTELNIDGDKEGRRWWRLCWTLGRLPGTVWSWGVTCQLLTSRTLINKQAVTETERWLSSEWVSRGDILRGPIFTGLHHGLRWPSTNAHLQPDDQSHAGQRVWASSRAMAAGPGDDWLHVHVQALSFAWTGVNLKLYHIFLGSEKS